MPNQVCARVAAGEIVALKSEAGAIIAASVLFAPGLELPPMPDLAGNSAEDGSSGSIQASDGTQSTDGDGDDSAQATAETRRERKALAAKAARKRARERLAGLELQVEVMQSWVARLRLLTSCGRSGHEDTLPAADNSSDDARTSCNGDTMPPKKRHRADLDVLEVSDDIG